jgi:hypothetical protein
VRPVQLAKAHEGIELASRAVQPVVVLGGGVRSAYRVRHRAPRADICRIGPPSEWGLLCMDLGSAGGDRVGSRIRKETGMQLFRRKATSEDEGELCPRCRERIPEGADECLMCGVDLRPLRRGSPDRGGNTPVRGGR